MAGDIDERSCSCSYDWILSWICCCPASDYNHSVDDAMSCYHPYKAIITPQGNPEYDKRYTRKSVKFLGRFNFQTDKEDLEANKISLIPCGKCLGCRLDYARVWSDRLILELEERKRAVFLTLTYDDAHLPLMYDENGEIIKRTLNEHFGKIAPLRKGDVSWFLKRLRERFNRQDMIDRIRKYNSDILTYIPEKNKSILVFKFFSAGEYGDKRGRPHIHMILYGLNLEDFNFISPLIAHDQNELGQITYRCKILEDLWTFGFVGISEANYLTMGYTARYTVKKALGNDYPKKYGLPDEFVLMSRNPGIGASFLKNHSDTVDEVSSWYVRGKDIYWPSYLIKKRHELKEDIEVFDLDGTCEHTEKVVYDKSYYEIKEAKEKLILDKTISKFDNDSRPYDQIMKLEEDMKSESVKRLQRGDVTLS